METLLLFPSLVQTKDVLMTLAGRSIPNIFFQNPPPPTLLPPGNTDLVQGIQSYEPLLALGLGLFGAGMGWAGYRMFMTGWRNRGNSEFDKALQRTQELLGQLDDELGETSSFLNK